MRVNCADAITNCFGQEFTLFSDEDKVKNGATQLTKIKTRI